MVNVIKEIGLFPEQVKRIKAAQKRHTTIDPGCENLSPEGFIRWRPINGMTWEERTRDYAGSGDCRP
jgi:hypothetical protein